mmetsp:Transcript_17741/g.22985  ORF Transcript_17741/g.22985 Transcript_17741/m.22985 type:complete len:152 (-) Transcript_17741:353-808(-)
MNFLSTHNLATSPCVSKRNTRNIFSICLKTVMQPWHCDDCVQQGIFHFSAIFNTDEHQAAKLHVCTGSHKMTHQEQWDNKVHVGYDTVTIPPGKFILFFRSLVHAGSMYETRQDRFFTYIDVGPISKKDSVQWPNPGRVYAYGDPSTKTSL